MWSAVLMAWVKGELQFALPFAEEWIFFLEKGRHKAIFLYLTLMAISGTCIEWELSIGSFNLCQGPS